MGFYAAALLIWTAVGAQAGFGRWALAGIAGALVQVIWHWSLIRTRQRDGCFRAFSRNHWVGFSVFVGVLVDLAVR